MQQSKRFWTGKDSINAKLSQKSHFNNLAYFVYSKTRLVSFWNRIEKSLPNSDQKFHHLLVSQEFDKPTYCIGEVVWHIIKVSNGQILHPVTITGLYWTGLDWEYHAMLPPNHPQFKPENNESEYLAEYQLERISDSL
jgi:hypothetical protein